MLFRNWFKGRDTNGSGSSSSSSSSTTSSSGRASERETFTAIVARRSDHRRRRSNSSSRSPRQKVEDDFFSDEDSDDEDYSDDDDNDEDDNAAADVDRERTMLGGGRNQSTAAFRRSHVARSFQSVGRSGGSISSDGRMFQRRQEHATMLSTSMKSIHTTSSMKTSTRAKLEPAVLKDLEVLFDEYEVSENREEEKESSEQAAAAPPATTRDLAVFQQNLVDDLDGVKTEVCKELVEWEKQRQRNEGPLSTLLECLKQLDIDLEDAMRKLDDETRSMYEFKKDTEDVQKEMRLRLEKKEHGGKR